MRRACWTVVGAGIWSILIGSACAAPGTHAEPAVPVVESHVLGLGHPPDGRFVYVVQPDGVYAVARAADAEGRPVFSRKRIKVASIEPALAPDDRRVVDRDGDLVPPPGRSSPPARVARQLTVLVADPAAEANLYAGPRTRAEFLALDDKTLVDYASAWLRYRGIDRGETTTLSRAERDVMLASLAFELVAGDGFSGLLAMRCDDLPEIRDSLRRIDLESFAEVIEKARQLAHDGQQAESKQLDRAWRTLADDPVPPLAAYIRAHADEIDWAQMRRE
jgi:hypothetical protein